LGGEKKELLRVRRKKRGSGAYSQEDTLVTTNVEVGRDTPSFLTWTGRRGTEKKRTGDASRKLVSWEKG